MPNSSSRSRVLVVDDDDMLNELTQCLLQALGMTTVGCQSTDEAITLLAQFNVSPFVAVLTDFNLGSPTHSGLVLLRHVQRHHPHLLRILMTGHVTDTVRDERRDGCVELLLEKPISGDSLASLVAWVADRR